MAATVNGIAIQDMTLRGALVGTWEATITADTTDPALVRGAATIELDGVRYVGTATANADEGGKTTARVVAGANGLGTTLQPRSYTGTTIRVLVADILRDCGETLSADADAATMSRTIEGWVRLRQTGRDALKRLVEFVGGIAWRTMRDGSVWIGPETWPTVEPDFTLIAEMPTENAVEVAIEALAVSPGDTFRSVRISEVEYRLNGGSLRLIAKTGAAKNEAGAALSNLIKRETQTDYFALYPARVVAQNVDGTLEVRLDSPAMPGMSRLPIRHGLPGVTAIEVQTGARVLVGFEGAQPSKPFACLWEGAGNMTRIRLTGVLEVGGTEAVALESAIASWCSSANTAIAAALTAAGSPAPPPGPLTGAASESLFTN